MNPTEIHVVLCTCPEGAVQALAERVLEARLVACVNVIAGVRSVYRWQGKIEDEVESLLVMKTQRARLAALTETLEQAHPYDVPEILALPVAEGSHPYLQWVLQETSATSE